MKRSTLAAIATAAVLAVGGGTAYALTSTQEPAPVETAVIGEPTPTADVPADGAQADDSAPSPATSTEPTPIPITGSGDEAFLAEVQRRMIPGSILDQFTNADLIAMGHDACAQLEAGAKFEDVRAVEGEKPYENGAYYETSAIMNSAILAYCPAQM